jgi:hypothetical protein
MCRSHVARARVAVPDHISEAQNAIRMLSERVTVIQRYLTDISKGARTRARGPPCTLGLTRHVTALLLRAPGDAPVDHALLRMIGSVCDRLPATTDPKFETTFVSSYNDTLLVTYLASITKGAASVNDVVDKLQVGFERRRRGPMAGGL